MSEAPYQAPLQPTLGVPSQRRPAHPLTFLRIGSARRSQQLCQRQEQDQQPGFPELHGGARSEACRDRPPRSSHGPPERGRSAAKPPGSSARRLASGEEAAGRPIPARIGTRAVAPRPHRHLPAAGALCVGAPSSSAFKTPSPSMRCPLLIGCAATTNHRLPLGLPGAPRPGKSAGRTKAPSPAQGAGLGRSSGRDWWETHSLRSAKQEEHV